jgi:hypothetical protein
MRTVLVIAVSLALGGCGGGSSTEPAAKDPVTPSSSSSPAPSADANAPCVATMTDRRPDAAIEEVGRISAHVKGSCSLDVQPKSGAKSVVACEPKTARQTISSAACGMGGDVAWLVSDPAAADATGDAQVAVGRFTKPDAKADLVLICAPFSTLKNPRTGKALDEGQFDASQRARIRAEVLEATMTSKQWRLWLRRLLDDRAAAVKELRDAARSAGLDCKAEWVAGR